jgi:hypothetical protein
MLLALLVVVTRRDQVRYLVVARYTPLSNPARLCKGAASSVEIGAQKYLMLADVCKVVLFVYNV